VVIRAADLPEEVRRTVLLLAGLDCFDHPGRVGAVGDHPIEPEAGIEAVKGLEG
jgi:hypothetical protein